MCDTLLLRRDGITYFAKNSDREPSEAQVVQYEPPADNDGSSTVQTTWMSIPQVPQQYGVILSRPAWMWGAEMGINDQGVVIGNEAVFTRLVDRQNSALLGMDLVRLALQRSATADRALTCICELLEEFGQAGPAGFRDKSFRYDNSYIIADATEAWVLETAGRHWVARRIESSAAISNALTIESEFDRSSEGLVDFAIEQGFFSGRGAFSFAAAFDTRLMKSMGCAVQRRELNCDSLQQLSGQDPDPGWIARSLRRHANNDRYSNRDVCMHAAGLLRPSQTCGSLAVQLQAGRTPRILMTGTSAPCLSLFQSVQFPTGGKPSQPIFFDSSVDASHSLWQQFERVHRLAMTDAGFRRELTEDRNQVEPSQLSGPPTAESIQAARQWHERWHAAACARPIRYSFWSARDRFWKRLDSHDHINSAAGHADAPGGIPSAGEASRVT